MSIDPSADRAVYRQLADLLREQIRSGVLRPGALVPSESRLGQQHGVGRETVRKAMAVMRAEGLVVTAQGDGTRVREASGPPVTVRLSGQDRAVVRMPDDIERRRAGLDVGVPIVEVHRGNADVDVYPADRADLVAG